MAGPLSNVLQYPQPAKASLPDPVEVDLGSGEVVSNENGVRKTEYPDGFLLIELEAKPQKAKSERFNDNLAEDMDDAELNRIASDLLDGINRDNDSRKDHLEMIAEGMKLLGLVLESNNSTSVASA